MPTRFIEPTVIRRAFDALVAPDAVPKEFLRWRELARQLGLNQDWIRKRYHGNVRSELDVRSVNLIRAALERKSAASREPALGALIAELSAATADTN